MVSLIIPCFNEEDALPIFYQEITNVMEEVPQFGYAMVGNARKGRLISEQGKVDRMEK